MLVKCSTYFERLFKVKEEENFSNGDKLLQICFKSVTHTVLRKCIKCLIGGGGIFEEDLIDTDASTK